VDLEFPPGESRARIPYDLPGTGRLLLELSLDGDVRFRAEAEFVANDLHSAAYGERLPASSDAVGLWWASSGWKIGRERPIPEAGGRTVLIRAARNEAEAAQAVVRPRRTLKAFTATPGALSGPGGASIPADRVEVLRVRYVEVTRPTDWSGAAAPWPDPLPPFRGPADLEAGLNHPLWIRVSVPRDAAPGAYSGSIDLRAEGWSAEVPLRVEVFGFALPDRMSCATAFGFDPGLVWRYQKLSTDAQRREVLEKYWRNFSAHRVSPYDPAPLDPYVVTWPGVSDWEGGTRVETEPRSGKSCLLVEDSSPTSQAGASCRTRVPIPPGGLRLRLWHRAEKGHAFIVTLGHLDAAGSWMPGRNNDIPVEGTGGWRLFEREVASFPAGAKAVQLTLWAAAWRDDGSPTGRVLYDDVSVQDLATGKERIPGGGFEPVAPGDLKPTFDWTRWDAATRRAVDEYHFNSFCVHVPGLGGGTFHSRVEPSLLGFGEKTPEYAAAFGNYGRALEAHLRENGWLDEAFVYWFDEPEPKDYAFVRNGFRKLKEAAPGIGRMLTEQPEEALFGGPDIWCPCTPAYDHEKAKARREAGDRIWWYVCTGPKAPWCTLFIDHPATELRLWLWQTWERRVQGVLVWQTNYWTSPSAYPDPARPQNPYEDPMGWVSGYDTPAGRRQPWGNGDGRFLYPPEAAADGNPPGPVLEGPVDSIRWEMLRDGIEDSEYLAILKRHVERLKPKLEPAEFRRLAELLAVPASITKSMTEFTKDPAPIEARRLEVARAIEALESR
jgi:hypothetical protein